MSNQAIQIENLSKRYRLGQGVAMERTFRELIQESIGAAVGKLRRPRVSGGVEDTEPGNGAAGGIEPLEPPEGVIETGRTEKAAGKSAESESRSRHFWALREVSLDIPQGQVVGIIGRNGAGKSTLLKVLSRITDPTEGRALIRGRVGSLLEVGTGFHPELTGRENVYLNGAVLGMTRREIAAKFDDIVAFAQIERFLDTPVKRYSSGMYVRLAFAVAAHLEPEILIVDEVLAVGDAAFQARCLGKMKAVAGQGRTVLFVSHNMAAVQQLCDRAVHLDAGRVIADGPAQQVVGSYLDSLRQRGTLRLAERKDRGGTGPQRIIDAAAYLDAHDTPTTVLAVGRSARLVFALSEPMREAELVFALYDVHGHLIADFDSRQFAAADHHDTPTSRVICDIPQLTLTPGTYRLNVALLDRQRVAIDHVEGAMTLRIEDGTLAGRAVPHGTRGVALLPHQWNFTRGEAAPSAADQIADDLPILTLPGNERHAA